LVPKAAVLKVANAPVFVAEPLAKRIDPRFEMASIDAVVCAVQPTHGTVAVNETCTWADPKAK